MKNVFQILLLYILFIKVLSGELRKKIKIYSKIKKIKLSNNDIIKKEINNDNNKTALNIENNSLDQNTNNTNKNGVKIEENKVKYINYRRDSSKWSTGTIVGLIVGGVVLIIGASILAIILRNHKRSSSPPPVDDKTKTVMYLKTDGVNYNANNNVNNNYV